MIFDMKLLQEPFERIKSGMKTIELRLLDEKRESIKINDLIHFSKLPELKEQITVKVTSLQTFLSFDEFATLENLNKLGVERTKEQFLNDIHKIYSLEKELKLGVLAIGIKLIG